MVKRFTPQPRGLPPPIANPTTALEVRVGYNVGTQTVVLVIGEQQFPFLADGAMNLATELARAADGAQGRPNDGRYVISRSPIIVPGGRLGQS